MSDDPYRWRGDAEQRRLYPYISTEQDIATFNLYAKRGFLPPQRPGGFLDAAEEQTWERWKAMSEHKLRGSAKIRSAFEVRPLLQTIATRIGELHGVVLNVEHTPEGLFFTNGTGDIVQDGPVHLIAASEEEIGSGEFLKFFTPRAFYAALCEAFAQDYVRRQMGGVN